MIYNTMKVIPYIDEIEPKHIIYANRLALSASFAARTASTGTVTGFFPGTDAFLVITFFTGAGPFVDILLRFLKRFQCLNDVYYAGK